MDLNEAGSCCCSVCGPVCSGQRREWRSSRARLAAGPRHAADELMRLEVDSQGSATIIGNREFRYTGCPSSDDRSIHQAGFLHWLTLRAER